LSWLDSRLWLACSVRMKKTFEAIFALKSKLKYKEALIANQNFTIVNISSDN